MEYIKKLFKRILLKSKKCICPHDDIRYVIIRDYLYDEMTDNDDLEDIPTLIKVTYMLLVLNQLKVKMTLFVVMN